MSSLNFPFAALVGLERLQLGLQLAAVDHRLSLLVRGERGAGKSTAARALGALLDEGSRFVDLPIGATEDRVLGGLDVERALEGESALKPGLLSEAHGGVLYIDEVNLLSDHLADALLDAVASGVHVVEREGFSARQEAQFVLVGSMNPEEGGLRPQLLDRFALVADVSTPTDPSPRSEAVQRRMAFDADPEAFAHTWRDEQHAFSKRLHRARQGVKSVSFSKELFGFVSEQVCARGVRSLRADLAIVRASVALAALEGVADVTASHVEMVLPLTLDHRASPRRSPSPPPPDRTSAETSAPEGAGGRDAQPEKVFDSHPIAMPRLVVPVQDGASGGANGAVFGARRGTVVGARPAVQPGELDMRSTLVHTLAHTGTPRTRPEDLHEKLRARVAGRRFVFVVDSSGSQGVQQRMRLVKGAVAGLMDTSVHRHDEVAVVVFRGAAAEIVLHPTCDAQEARAALTYLPTGGRTPLAHGLELAASLITEDTAVVLLTDGRANVPSRTEDSWADALNAAAAITCPVLVIDSETGPHPSGRARQLADRMHGTHFALDALDEVRLVDLVRPMAERATAQP